MLQALEGLWYIIQMQVSVLTSIDQCTRVVGLERGIVTAALTQQNPPQLRSALDTLEHGGSFGSSNKRHECSGAHVPKICARSGVHRSAQDRSKRLEPPPEILSEGVFC